MQPLQNEGLADRRNAVCGRSGNLRALNCLIEGVCFLPADAFGICASADLRRFTDGLCHPRTDAGKGTRQKLRHGSPSGVLEHRYKLAKFDAIRMGFDLLRFDGKLGRGSPVGAAAIFRIHVMNGDVRVGDRRLLEVFVHAAAPPLIAAFEFDRDSRSAVQRPRRRCLCRVRILRRRIVRHPFDAVIADVLMPFLSGRDVFSITFAIDDLGLVALGVDLNLEVMRRLSRRRHGDDLHRLSGREHAVHTRSADADSLLAAAHPEPMELRAVEELSEDQRYLLLDNPRAVVLHADLVAVGAGSLQMDPYLRHDSGFLAGIERVIYGFLDGREKGFSRIVKTEKMAILGKELADGDVTLLRRHRLGGGASWSSLGGGAGFCLLIVIHKYTSVEFPSGWSQIRSERGSAWETLVHSCHAGGVRENSQGLSE